MRSRAPRRSRATRPKLMEGRRAEIQANSRRGGAQVMGSKAGGRGGGEPLPRPPAMRSDARASDCRKTDSCVLAFVDGAGAGAALEVGGADDFIRQTRDADICITE